MSEMCLSVMLSWPVRTSLRSRLTAPRHCPSSPSRRCQDRRRGAPRPQGRRAAMSAPTLRPPRTFLPCGLKCGPAYSVSTLQLALNTDAGAAVRVVAVDAEQVSPINSLSTHWMCMPRSALASRPESSPVTVTGCAVSRDAVCADARHPRLPRSARVARGADAHDCSNLTMPLTGESPLRTAMAFTRQPDPVHDESMRATRVRGVGMPDTNSPQRRSRASVIARRRRCRTECERGRTGRTDV